MHFSPLIACSLHNCIVGWHGPITPLMQYEIKPPFGGGSAKTAWDIATVTIAPTSINDVAKNIIVVFIG